MRGVVLVKAENSEAAVMPTQILGEMEIQFSRATAFRPWKPAI